MVEPIFLGALAGFAGLIVLLARNQTNQRRRSLLAFARKRKGRPVADGETSVLVEVRGIPVRIEINSGGLRALTRFALGSGPSGAAQPGLWDSEDPLWGVGMRSPEQLAARLLTTYRWTGAHRALRPFIADCARTLTSTALSRPEVTIAEGQIVVTHLFYTRGSDTEDLAEGISELAAAIACWQMARVEEAAEQLRAPVVMRVRDDVVEPECTVDRVRFVFQLDGSLHLVVRATIRCDPRVSLQGAIDRNGLTPVLAEDAIPPRARELLPALGACTLQLRQGQDASLRWADASSAEELASGALFLQAVATKKEAGGAFR